MLLGEEVNGVVHSLDDDVVQRVVHVFHLVPGVHGQLDDGESLAPAGPSPADRPFAFLFLDTACVQLIVFCRSMPISKGGTSPYLDLTLRTARVKRQACSRG